MKKGLILAGLLVGSVFTVQAQDYQNVELTKDGTQVNEFGTYRDTKHRVITNKFWSNWFVSIGAGAQMNFSDHNKQMKFSDRLTPNFNVNVGKWFTPVIGARLGMDGLRLKGVAGWDGHSLQHPNVNVGNYNGFIVNGRRTTDPRTGAVTTTGDVYTGKSHVYPLYKTSQKYLHAHGDLLFNFSNLFFGYNPKRFWSFIPYASVGYAWSNNKDINGDRAREIAFGGGLLNEFRLSKAFAIQLDVRATGVSDRFDGQLGDNTIMDGILSASLGVTYKFGRQGWLKEAPYPMDDSELNALRAQLADLEAQNANLRNRPEVVREVEPLLLMLSNVTFDFDQDVITPESSKILDDAATILKKVSDRRFLISGFTDARGGKTYNENLSARRAAAVVKALEDRGVPSDMLKSRGVGKRATTMPVTESDEVRAGDRKVTIELISNMEYWNKLPKTSY